MGSVYITIQHNQNLPCPKAKESKTKQSTAKHSHTPGNQSVSGVHVEGGRTSVLHVNRHCHSKEFKTRPTPKRESARRERESGRKYTCPTDNCETRHLILTQPQQQQQVIESSHSTLTQQRHSPFQLHFHSSANSVHFGHRQQSKGIVRVPIGLLLAFLTT